MIAPMYKQEAVRRDPPTQKTVNYYNDLKNKYRFGKYLPKDFTPITQKEYGLGINIMAAKQYELTGGKYGKPRKLNRGKNNEK